MEWLDVLTGYPLALALGLVATRCYLKWRRYTVFLMSVPVKRNK